MNKIQHFIFCIMMCGCGLIVIGPFPPHTARVAICVGFCWVGYFCGLSGIVEKEDDTDVDE